MVIINIYDVNNGYSFNIDTEKNKRSGKEKYYFENLTIDILKYLKKKAEDEIYEKYFISLKDDSEEEIKTIEDTAEFKKWRYVGNTKFILFKGNIILDNDNFKNIELQENDIINYVIKPRF